MTPADIGGTIMIGEPARAIDVFKYLALYVSRVSCVSRVSHGTTP